MAPLGRFPLPGSLFGDSAILHPYCRTVFCAQEQKQEYGNRTIRTPHRHPGFTSHQRICRRLARLERNVSHRSCRDADLHGTHPQDYSRDETQLYRKLQRIDDYRLRNLCLSSAHPPLLHSSSLRFRQYDGYLVLSGFPPGSSPVLFG